MIQYQIQTYVQNLNRLGRHRKNYVVFQKYGRDVTRMTSLTQNQLKKIGDHQSACKNLEFP